MIKINLLPIKEKKRRQQVLIIVYVVMALVAVAAVLGWLLSTQYRRVAELNAEIARIDDESAGYQEKIREIKELEASQAKLDGFRKIAQAVASDQRKILGSLDTIASQLPDEVWINDIDQGRDKNRNQLTIHGYSFSQPMLELFARNLGRPSAFLSGPSLTISQSSVLTENNHVYQYEIKANMVAPK
jgi:Tfp pilus assembly protein PilN